MFDAKAFLEGLYRPAPPAWADLGPDDLPGDWRMEFEERAAIKEFAGGLPREMAEAEALAETVAEMQNGPPDAGQKENPKSAADTA
ncbi:MAG: hypothetical protein PHF00_13975 [Elusimicrobia bacterium]|nr:hypothetical protein [Elusimicrobiota bacterium]